MSFQEWLDRHDACPEARDWVADQSEEDAYAAVLVPAWLTWYSRRRPRAPAAQYAQAAISAALLGDHVEAWIGWANAWLAGEDRSLESAIAAAALAGPDRPAEDAALSAANYARAVIAEASENPALQASRESRARSYARWSIIASVDDGADPAGVANTIRPFLQPPYLP